MKRPKVTVSCVADKYHAPRERIIEFTFPDGRGGLISFGVGENGVPTVQVYRVDDGIRVLGKR